MRSLILSLGVAAGVFGLADTASAHGPHGGYYGPPVVVRPAYPVYPGYYRPVPGYPAPYYGGFGYPGYARPAYYGGYAPRPYYGGFGYPGYVQPSIGFGLTIIR
jgi:hypothetical protein